MIKISTTEMEIAIARHFGFRANYIVPNISWGAGLHECDMLVINCKTGVATEIEIKISISDLKADFKKRHGHRSKKIKYLYYAVPLSMLGACKEFLGESTGIITVERVIPDERQPWTTFLRSHLHRRAKKNGDYHWQEHEILNVTRLGCMRIWALKETVVSKHREILQIKNGNSIF